VITPMENNYGSEEREISFSSFITPFMKLWLIIVCGLLIFPLKYLEIKIVLKVPLPYMVTIMDHLGIP
jgi:hypothetical protein